jgi:hypothetical protein
VTLRSNARRKLDRCVSKALSRRSCARSPAKQREASARFANPSIRHRVVAVLCRGVVHQSDFPWVVLVSYCRCPSRSGKWSTSQLPRSGNEERTRRQEFQGPRGHTPASEPADCRIPGFHKKGTGHQIKSQTIRHRPSLTSRSSPIGAPAGGLHHLSIGVVQPFVQVEVRESGVLVVSDPSLSAVAWAASGVSVPAPKLPSSVSESADDEPGGAEYTLSF